MVWAGMSETERTTLVIIRDNLNGQRYRDEVLQPFAVPFLQVHPQLDIYQHDNATPHTSRVARQFLAANNVEVMPVSYTHLTLPTIA